MFLNIGLPVDITRDILFGQTIVLRVARCSCRQGTVGDVVEHELSFSKNNSGPFFLRHLDTSSATRSLLGSSLERLCSGEHEEIPIPSILEHNIARVISVHLVRELRWRQRPSQKFLAAHPGATPPYTNFIEAPTMRRSSRELFGPNLSTLNNGNQSLFILHVYTRCGEPYCESQLLTTETFSNTGRTGRDSSRAGPLSERFA